MHHTNRLILRPMTMDDAESLFSYRSIPQVNTYTYTPVWTSLDDARKHLENYVPKVNSPASGFGKWMIVRQDTNEVIGDVFLSKDSELQGTTEVGYMIHPNHAGHGFATEAVHEALRIGFEEWGVHRIYARVDEENVGSVRVCQKLGMRQEGYLLENDRRGDVWSNELVFAMLDREWSQVMEQRPGLVPPNEYYRTLPRRRLGAGVLITDDAGRVLLLETTYKDNWEIPGGVCEAGESPRDAAKREVLEEIGIDIELGSLLVFDHRSEPEPKGDAIMMVYDAGVISDASSVKIDPEEIKAAQFVPIDLLDRHVRSTMALRLRAAIRARHEQRLIEIDATGSSS